MRIVHVKVCGLLVQGLLFTATSALAQAGAGPAHPGEVSADIDRASAAALFAEGVAHARAGRYAPAKQAFLEAYRARPHYSVLYNVAQAEIRLSRPASAIEYLERYVREGGDALSSDQREEVTMRIVELQEGLPRENEPSIAAVNPKGSSERDDALSNDDVSTEPVNGGSPTPQAPPSPGDVTPPQSAYVLPDPPAFGGFRPDDVSAATPSTSPWGVILTSSGAALLGTALGLYVWNGDRQERWLEARAELDAVPDLDVALRSDAELWQEANANNRLLASIQRVDIVALVTAGLGALAVGAGAWELVARPASTQSAFTTAGSSFNWRTVW